MIPRISRSGCCLFLRNRVGISRIKEGISREDKRRAIAELIIRFRSGNDTAVIEFRTGSR